MQFVLEESLAKRHLYFSFARVSALPPIEANDANDFVNIVYHTLDDDRGLGISCFFEELLAQPCATNHLTQTEQPELPL